MQDSVSTPGRGPGPGFGRDLTQGSILHNLLRLSWPMVISNVLMMLGPTIDMIWVGRLGSAAMAAVGVAGIAVQIIMGAMMGIMMGMRALVARFIGAGDVRGANHVAQQAFVLSGVSAGAAALVGVFLSEQIMGLFDLSPDVIAEGSGYLRIMFVGAAAISFRIMAEGVMQASGDAVTPMSIAIIYRLFHVALCPFLIFGWWIFPEMGVRGAAMTNVVSQFLGVALGMGFLLTGRSVHFDWAGWWSRLSGGRALVDGASLVDGALPTAAPPPRVPVRFGASRMRLTFREFRLDPAIIWRILRIGLPSMVSGMQRTLSQFFLMFFVAPFGTAAVAAHSVAQRVEMVLFMPGMAFGMAAGVLAGQNLGAGRPERAERSAWIAVGMVEAFLITASVAILLSAEGIVGIFNSEPDVVLTASGFLRIAVLGYAILGLTSVLMNTLSGAGDTVPPMIVSLATIWLIQLPLAYFLPRETGMGVYGIRWAMVITMVVSGVAYLAYFRTGRWKRKRV